MTTPQNPVQRVFLITLGLNLFVAFSKIMMGIMTGALAVTADGLHSLTDGTGNIVGIIATTLAQRPPDDEHPYGHHRFEALAALVIAGFLSLLAWEMGTTALERLSGSAEPPTLTPLMFVVLVGTLVINIGVTTYQIREGKRLKSALLLADAAHTRSDVFVTISVIVSMGLMMLTGIEWIDLVAAAVVIMLILRAAWHIIRHTGSVLVDSAPYPPETLADIVSDVPNVLGIVRARSRGTTDAAHIDVDVMVPAKTTVAETATITEAIRRQLYSALDGISEVEVHFMPE
jgi:cation diffusion facilitator family transporter